MVGGSVHQITDEFCNINITVTQHGRLFCFPETEHLAFIRDFYFIFIFIYITERVIHKSFELKNTDNKPALSELGVTHYK